MTMQFQNEEIAHAKYKRRTGVELLCHQISIF